jgi:hypothetical protein
VRRVYEGALTVPGGLVKGRILETAIPLGPGDTGSPLLNRQAMLVGLKLAGDPDKRQVSLAVDLAEIRQFLAEAIPPEQLKSRMRRKAAPNSGNPCDVVQYIRPAAAFAPGTSILRAAGQREPCFQQTVCRVFTSSSVGRVEAALWFHAREPRWEVIR